MANTDQSSLIELDANLSPTILIKQLVSRLQSYVIRRATKPLRINDVIEGGSEEEGGAETHFIDSGEIEETMTALQIRRRLAPRFKWRRSKCAFYCPVSLKNGRIVSGKSEYAAAFLDKIYLMADEDALKDFLKNPRPYLRLPQPRAPCKLSVLGANYSGKTALCATLARKYNARVINMDTAIEPEIKKARQSTVEKARSEAIQQASEFLRVRFREKREQERSNFFLLKF